MHHYYIIEALFIILGLCVLAVIIRYPRQLLINLPLSILKFPFKWIWSRIKLPFEFISLFINSPVNKRVYRKVRRFENKLDVRVKDEDDLER